MEKFAKSDFLRKSHFLPKIASKNVSKYLSKSTWSLLNEKCEKVILANFRVSGGKVVTKQCKLLSQTHFAKKWIILIFRKKVFYRNYFLKK